jgi:hypothetical protein
MYLAEESKHITPHQLPYPSSPSPITDPLLMNHADPKHHTRVA